LAVGPGSALPDRNGGDNPFPNSTRQNPGPGRPPRPRRRRSGELLTMPPPRRVSLLLAGLLGGFCAAAGAAGQPPARPDSNQADVTAQPAVANQENAGPGAEKGGDKDKKEEKEESYSVHGQATVVSQGNWKFRSPYEGPNSLPPLLSYRTTNTDTLFLAGRVWSGGVVVFNPEVAGGTGIGHTLGLAGFPNGEATRIGTIAPTPYVARLLLRQTFDLGGDPEKVEAGPNQLAGTRDTDRITVSIGKMAATDVFDDNRFSHDPRTQFLNWSLMYNGAWDYPANVRGYTYGFVIDGNTRYLALRYGAFAEPAVAQGQEFDPHFLRANGQIVELEERWCLDDRPGKLREWAFLNHAHMGNYREALAA